MFKQKPTYWLPRIGIIAFAISLALPLPRFLSGMDHGQFVLWLARLFWVLGIVGIVFLLFMAGVLIRKIMANKKSDPT